MTIVIFVNMSWPPWYVVLAIVFLILYFAGDTDLFINMYNRAMNTASEIEFGG